MSTIFAVLSLLPPLLICLALATSALSLELTGHLLAVGIGLMKLLFDPPVQLRSAESGAHAPRKAKVSPDHAAR